MTRKSRPALALLAAAAVLAACGTSAADSGEKTEAGEPQRGGTVTVLERTDFAGSWPTGLDPATNTTGGANMTQMNAVFGGLFVLEADEDGKNAKVEPDLAKGYELAPDGTTLTITLRPGVTFSDGTPFDAAAVAWNLQRNLASTCSCAPKWPLAATDPITTQGDDTVVVHFSRPYAAVVNAFPVSNVNWIASPTAFEKLGADEFKIKPVGAGPFTVESNTLNSELVLVRNPSYFKEGQPYLDKLVVKSIEGDQPAYQALLAGQAQAYESMQTTPLVEQARANGELQVTQAPATSPYLVQLNTAIAPFDDQKAREAIYYATDPEAINKGIFKGKTEVDQSFTGSGGLFYQKDVPGYRTHDVAKAKALVQELGGLTVDLGVLSSYVAEQVGTALKTQWEQAGITVNLHSDQLNVLINNFKSQQWQAMLQTVGAWDPAAGTGVTFRFGSGFPYSGVRDAELDGLFDQAAASLDEGSRKDLYDRAGKLISDKAYAPYILAITPSNVAVKGVHGPGLTTPIPPLVGVNPTILWDSVWTTNR
ncbi:ABC transporter substrate-binding protein [Modestobacter sp. NPDC049651]|uniref:ABC transporter substrate-binding protein n=1 Tax=unclassified Modestobacter TaxID=2643866 RepID=UPI0033D3F544